MINRYWPIHMHPILKMNKHKIGEAKNFEKIYFNEQIDLPISATMTVVEAKELMRRFENCVKSLIIKS